MLSSWLIDHTTVVIAQINDYIQTKGLRAVRCLIKYNIYSKANSYKSAVAVEVEVGFGLGLIPVTVLTKSFLTLQCGVPWPMGKP